jgi:hypothetical protein
LRRRRIREAATGAALAMTGVALVATLLLYLLFGQNVRRVLGATSDRGIGGTTELRRQEPPRPQPPR